MRSATAPLLVLCQLWSGCGAHVEVPVVRSDLSVAELGSIELSLLLPEGSDGAALSCATLGDRWAELPPSAVIVFAQLLSATANAVLEYVPPGASYVLVAEAFAGPDGTGARMGLGCVDGVDIPEGRATSISVTLAQIAR